MTPVSNIALSLRPERPPHAAGLEHANFPRHGRAHHKTAAASVPGPTVAARSRPPLCPYSSQFSWMAPPAKPAALSDTTWIGAPRSLLATASSALQPHRLGGNAHKSSEGPDPRHRSRCSVQRIHMPWTLPLKSRLPIRPPL